MPNVAIIVLDTLRKDYFDEYFDWLPGKRFENAWSTSHWTIPAHASLFTGKYASEVGVHARGTKHLDCKETVLAEQLNNGGYTTRGFSSNVNISKQFNWHRGFDEFEGSWRLNAIEENTLNWDDFIVENEEMGPERFLLALYKCFAEDYNTISSLKQGVKMKLRDLGYSASVPDDGAQEAYEYIRSTMFGDNEFLFMNLMEAHTPYDPPKEYKSVDVDLSGLTATLEDGPVDDPNDIRQAYEDCVEYLSDIYQDIFSALTDDFDYIITVGDHGEMLGENDVWEHLYGIYPELSHIPLVITTPNQSSETITTPVNLLDVHETILSCANLEAPNGRGRSLCGDLSPQDHLVEYHGIAPIRYKALENEGYENLDRLQTELYGIAAGDYYGFETFDGGFVEHGVEPSDIQSRLTNLTENRAVMSVEADDNSDVSEAVKSQLEDLGYA